MKNPVDHSILEDHNEKDKLRGLYVVTERSCLDLHTGAAQHIKIGFRELSQSFQMDAKFLKPLAADTFSEVDKAEKVLNCRTPDNNSFMGALRDIKYLLKNTKEAFSLLALIKRHQPDFVYLRAHFLDPLPFLLKVANIPCFIEANGLQFESRQNYYTSLLTGLNRAIEAVSYATAQHVFFVGSYGDYWQLRQQNWTNVENGVESDFVGSFTGCEKPSDAKIHVALIARLMAHHQPKLLVSALQNLDPTTRSKLCLHLIGSKLEPIEEALQTSLEVINHGFLSRIELADVLGRVHAGVIPGVPEYQSQMKLFDYGAAKCVAIVPRVHNFQYWFSEEDVVFFDPGNSDSLSEAFQNIVDDPQLFLIRGDNLHQHIANKFTWNKIFAEKIKVIEGCFTAG